MNGKYYLYTGFVDDFPTPDNQAHFIYMFGSPKFCDLTYRYEVGYVETYIKGRNQDQVREGAAYFGATAYFPARHC